MINAYTIGINLVASSNVGQVVGQMNQAMNGIQRQTTAMARQMQALNNIMNGHQMMRAGERILGGIGDLVEAGRELNTQFTQTLMTGGQIAREAANMRRDTFVWAQSIPGWNQAQLLALHREISTQVGVEEARHLVPTLARLGTNIAFTSGGRDGGPHAVLEAYRTVEAVGGAYEERNGHREFSQERFERYMNAIQGSLVASGGMVRINDMLLAARRGGPSLRSMAPEVLFPYLAEAAIQMGAQPAGTASMSWAQQFAGGIMTQRTAQGLEHAGLLNRQEYDVRRGGAVVLHQDARHRLAGALADPAAWVRDVLGPKIQGLPNAEVMSIVMGMFGRSTTQRLITDLEQNSPQFFRMRENAANVPGVQQMSDMLNATSIAQNMNNIHAAWQTLEQTLVDAAAPEIVTVLHTVTDGIRYVTTVAGEHPEATKNLLGLGLAIGSFTALNGSLVVLRGTLGLMGFGGAVSFICRITGLSTVGGAVMSVGRAVSFICGIPGLAGAALSLTGIGTALATIIGAIRGFSLTPEEHQNAERHLQQLDLQRRPTAPSQMAPTDGYGVDGAPTGGAAKPQREGWNHWQMPGSRPVQVALTGSIPFTAGGRELARFVADNMADQLAQPPNGSFRPDRSASIQWGPSTG